VLTKAKLSPPANVHSALERLTLRLEAAQRRADVPMEGVPQWVRRFFHPSTLASALRFADECIETGDAFLLACLLGILHHQRPGFLSYPSSHLVPYLRERNFPRSEFPEMYEERALAPRLHAKVMRAMKARTADWRAGPGSVEQLGIEAVRWKPGVEVDAIITSPPYMNALDYVRDNRLRMWFLDRSTSDYAPEATDKKKQFNLLGGAFVKNALSALRIGGRCVLVVGETVSRKRMTTHPAEELLKMIQTMDSGMELERAIADVIPDVRRTRRASAATKKELILVLRRSSKPDRCRITSQLHS
jgi:hypothetical protein